MIRPIHGGNLAWAAALADCPPQKILDFSANINPLGPPKSVITAIGENIGKITAYPDTDYRELRAAIAEVHQIDPQWVLPGNGVSELLTWSGWELAKQELTCILTPAFNDYWRCLRAFNAKIIKCPVVPGENFADLPVPSLPVYYTQPGLLLNNPHNPTGLLFDRQTISFYLKEFGLVVVDESFMDFLPPQEQQSVISLVKDYPNLVVLRSMTKFYSLPGLRLGYAIAHPDRLQRWQKRRDPWPVNTLAAAAGVAALKDKYFQQQTWDWLSKARKKLFHDLAKLPGLTPIQSSVNFLLIRSEKSCIEIQETLLKNNHILIRDCLSFPELGDRYFRVSVRSQEDNKRLVQALTAIL